MGKCCCVSVALLMKNNVVLVRVRRVKKTWVLLVTVVKLFKHYIYTTHFLLNTVGL